MLQTSVKFHLAERLLAERLLAECHLAWNIHTRFNVDFYEVRGRPYKDG